MTISLRRQPLDADGAPHRERSDAQRDAEKYRQLVLALRHATKQLRTLESRGQVDVEAALTEMLPDIATAFQAENAFIARRSTTDTGKDSCLVFITFHPADWGCGELPTENSLFESVMASNQPRVLESRDGERQDPIRGLEFCRATSAILVPVRLLDHHYIVGICNKLDHAAGPFLASDRMTLANLLELVAVGGRAGESRRRELESIEQISKVATTGSPQAVADAIVRQAVAVTQSRYAALWTLNKHSMQMEFLTIYHAHDPTWLPPQRTLDLDDTSFISFAAANNTMLHVQDVDELDIDMEERYLRWDPETRAALCMPLTFHDKQVLGVLYVAGAVADGITNERRRFLEQLAPHAAIALHNTRLREIRQGVIHFQHDVSDIMPLNAQLDQILNHLRRQVDISGLFLAMYNAERDEITFPLVFERDRAVDEQQKLPGAFYGPRTPGKQRLGFVEWVLQYRETLLVENFPTWPQRYTIDLADRRGVKSCLVVPLIRQERIVGAIGLRSYFAARGNFDEYDRRFLEGVADQVAIILSNSQHYDATQQALEVANQRLTEQIQAMRAVSEFQRRISDIDEEAAEIKSIYPELRDAMQGIGLDVSNMYVALYDEMAETIAFPLAYEHGQPIEETVKQGSALYSRTTFGEHRSVAEWIMQRWQREKTRDALLIDSKFDEWIEAHGIRSFPTGTQCWLGAPMVCNDKLLGMIGLRNPDREYAFQEEHKELLETIAGQAAVAIDNARLYETQVRNVTYFQALHEAGKAITRAGLALDDVLQAILAQAVKVTNSFFGTIQLAGEGYLEFVAAWPKSTEAGIKTRFGRMPLNGQGVTVRAARLNDAQLIPNVHLDPDYIDATGETGSAIAVVLRHGGELGKQPMGVLNVEHHAIGGLTARERNVLIGLANLAVVAVENAQNADQLSRTNAVAVMGAWGADIVHDIHREVGVIRLTIDTLRTEPVLSREHLLQRLNEIDEYIQNLIMPPLPEPLVANGATGYERDTVPLDLVIEAEVTAMRRRHGGVTFDVQTGCTGVEAKIHEQWLRRLLRHLVVNSVLANREHTALAIMVGTAAHNGHVEIWVEDNGRGIRPEIVGYLFHRPVPHQGTRSRERHGRGLLLVRHIVELHGGHAWLKSNEAGKGACVAFTVPRVTSHTLVNR